MPRHEHPPGSAADWLERAKSDLCIAKAPLPEGAFYENLCFHAQQVVEKALKAVYVHNGWPYSLLVLDKNKGQGFSDRSRGW